MKHFSFLILFFFALNTISRAQNQVIDAHPRSSIFVINYTTGQTAFANYDAAILFKDAFIELVSNTNTSRMLVSRTPGQKVFTITQLDPGANGNAYQLVLENKFYNQTSVVYTFVYNADQNALTYFNPQTQNYLPVNIQGPNLNNLNNCFNYGKFNPPPAAPTAVDAAVDDNTPVDAEVSVAVVPPALPEYEQPACPQDGYLWQPGYWAYRRDGAGYYWVPGAWVAPPTVGYLWTPPYWGFEGGFYIFHAGYWGNHIGFYGGINYGYGYGGHGYYGGDWHEGHFRYNTAVVNVNVTVVHNTYVDKTVIVNQTTVNRTSFNGQGGIAARPDEREMAAMHEQHVMATSEQIRNQRMAREDKTQFAAANGGRPASLAAPHVPERSQGFNNGGHGPMTNAASAGPKPGVPANGPKPGAPAYGPKPGKQKPVNNQNKQDKKH